MDIDTTEINDYFKARLKELYDPDRSIVGDLKVYKQLEEHSQHNCPSTFKLKYPVWQKYCIAFLMKFIYNDNMYMKLGKMLEDRLELKEDENDC